MIDLQTEPDGRATLVLDTDGVDGADAEELAAAARDAVKHAFDSGSARQVAWRAPVGDSVSLRAAWLLGTSFEGVNRRGWVTPDGSLVDAWTGTLLPDDTLEASGTWIDAVRLEGERVVLRAVTWDDEQRYLETNTDPESVQWLGTVGLATTTEAFSQRMAKVAANPAQGQAIEWTVAEREDDRFVGAIALFDLQSLDYKSAELGYRAHPDARGRGLFTDALRLVVDHAFAPEDAGGLGRQRLHLGAGDGNTASQALARRLGFVETGRDRRCYELADGRIVDLIRFDLLIDEWRER